MEKIDAAILTNLKIMTQTKLWTMAIHLHRLSTCHS